MAAPIHCSCHHLASTIAPTSTSSTELSNAPSQTLSPPSKIHFRPGKIRRLFPTQSPSCNGKMEIAIQHPQGADLLLVPWLELNHRTPAPPSIFDLQALNARAVLDLRAPTPNPYAT